MCGTWETDPHCKQIDKFHETMRKKNILDLPTGDVEKIIK